MTLRQHFPYVVSALLMIMLSACRETSVGPTSDVDVPQMFSTSSSSSLLLYGTDSSTDALYTIDRASGATSLIGPLDPDPNVFTTPLAMAIRPSVKTIFIWNNSSQAVTGVLLTADPCTGLATPVDASTPNQGQLTSLAFHPDGRLFGVDFSLFWVDPTTGVRTLIGSLGSSLRGGGAAFDASGTLYIVDLTLDPTQRLATVNLNTGAATVIGNLSTDIGRIGALVFAADGTLIGSGFNGPQGNILFDIDPATGTVSNIRSTTNPTQGMGFAPPCVVIDIKPESDVNPVNPRSHGVIPVAILGSEFFDVTTVDQSTLAFGQNGAPIAHKRAHFADVNDDSLMDLLAHFRTQETGIAAGDNETCLSAETFDGTMIEACDGVRTVPVRSSGGSFSGGQP
jgi:WD40 repeat protein